MAANRVAGRPSLVRPGHGVIPEWAPGTGTRHAVPMRELRRPLVMAGLLAVAANLRTTISSVGPVLDEVRHDLHLGSGTAPVLISLPLVAFAVVAPVAPVLGRRLGLELTLALSLVGLAIGAVVRSVPGPGLLWVGTALLGVTIAVLNVVLPALVKRDFPDRIGPVTGAYSATQAAFSALAAGLAVPLARASGLGWRLSLGIWAVLALIGLLIFAPQLRRHSLPVDEDEVAPALGSDRGAERAQVWRSPLAWQVTLFMGLQSINYFALITWLPTIERDAGISAGAAGVHQVLFNLVAIGGSIGCSLLIPRLRDQRLLAVLGSLLFVVGVGGVAIAPRAAWLWDCFSGVAGGMTIVLALSFIGLRTRHHHDAAALSGMAQSMGYLLAAIGPVAVGLVHGATGSWTPPLLLLVAVNGALVAVALLAGRDRVITA